MDSVDGKHLMRRFRNSPAHCGRRDLGTARICDIFSKGIFLYRQIHGRDLDNYEILKKNDTNTFSSRSRLSTFPSYILGSILLLVDYFEVNPAGKVWFCYLAVRHLGGV